MKASEFETIVKTRLLQLFADMSAGLGVSPARRLRLEGYLQAGVEMGLLSRSHAVSILCECYAEQFGESLAVDAPILGDPKAELVDIRIPLRYPVAGDADRTS